MTLTHYHRRRWHAKVERSIAELQGSGPGDSGAHYFLIGSRSSYALAKVEDHVLTYFDYQSGQWVPVPAVTDDQVALEPHVVEVSPSLAHHLMTHME